MSETDSIKACLGFDYTNLRCSVCKTQNYHINFILRVNDGDMGLEEDTSGFCDPWCAVCDDNVNLEEIPKKKPKTLKIIKSEYKEDPLICGNVVDGVAIIGCGATTYQSHQPSTWQHGYWAYCKKCQET